MAGGRRELAPRRSATRIGCICCVAWTDTSHIHKVRTTTTHTHTAPIHPPLPSSPPPHHHHSPHHPHLSSFSPPLPPLSLPLLPLTTHKKHTQHTTHHTPHTEHTQHTGFKTHSFSSCKQFVLVIVRSRNCDEPHSRSRTCEFKAQTCACKAFTRTQLVASSQVWVVVPTWQTSDISCTAIAAQTPSCVAPKPSRRPKMKQL